MIVVFDTNVIVAAFLRPGSPCDRILRLVLQGDLGVALDERMMGEYREILLRPKFALPRDAVEMVLDRLDAVALPCPAGLPSVRLPDPGDVPFLEVALAVGARALITGNVRHYPKAVRGGLAVFSPSEFLRLAAEQGL